MSLRQAKAGGALPTAALRLLRALAHPEGKGSWLEGEGGEGLMAASRAQLPVLTCVLRYKMDWM